MQERFNQFKEAILKDDIPFIENALADTTNADLIKAKDADGNTLLHYAVVKTYYTDEFYKGVIISYKKNTMIGNVEIVSKLIEAKADVNAKGEHNLTPLQNAAQIEGNVEIVSKLIEAKADVNDDPPPLLMALNTRNNAEIVSKLIDAGADVKKADAYAKKHGSFSLLMTALAKGYKIDTVSKLIDNGADVNAKGKDSMDAKGNYVSPLHMALVQEINGFHNDDNIKIIFKLVDSKANVNAMDDRDNTPLHLAVQLSEKEGLEIVSKLIMAGANINVRNTGLEMPIFIALNKKNLDIAEKLFDKGADVNATDEDGNSLLYCAVKSGAANIVEKLFNPGTDIINAKDKDGNPLFYLAIKEGGKVLSIFIKAGVNVNAKYKKQTPLVVAIDAGNVDSVKQLINAGADVNADATGEPDEWYRMPLSIAVRNFQVDIVKQLINAGADLNIIIKKLISAGEDSSKFKTVDGSIDTIANLTIFGFSKGEMTRLKEIKTLIKAGPKSEAQELKELEEVEAKKKLEEKQKQTQAEQAEKEALEKRIKELESLIPSLENAVSSKKTELSEKENQIHLLEQEIQDLEYFTEPGHQHPFLPETVVLGHLHHMNNNLEHETKELKKVQAELLHQQEMLANNIAELNGSKKTLDKLNEKKDEEENPLKATLVTLQQKLNHLKQNHTELVKNITTLQTSLKASSS